MPPRNASPSPLSADDLREIIAKHLPEWLRACAGDTEIIVMHGEAFGTSGGELFLFGCAVKYAAQTGKAVHVTCGRDDDGVTADLVFPAASIDAIYLEGVKTRDPARSKRKSSTLRPP